MIPGSSFLVLLDLSCFFYSAQAWVTAWKSRYFFFLKKKLKQRLFLFKKKIKVKSVTVSPGCD